FSGAHQADQHDMPPAQRLRSANFRRHSLGVMSRPPAHKRRPDALRGDLYAWKWVRLAKAARERIRMRVALIIAGVVVVLAGAAMIALLVYAETIPSGQGE